MNPLLAFYLGSHPDDRGRMLAEILRQDDFWLEVTHDYVQWLFPLDEVSGANARAPLVDGPTRDHFRGDPLLQRHLRASLLRMLRFFGLRLAESGEVVPGDHWAERKRQWFTHETHNSLRLTRMIKSLNLLGMANEARALQSGLEALCREDPQAGISSTTRAYWRDAIETGSKPAVYAVADHRTKKAR